MLLVRCEPTDAPLKGGLKRQQGRVVHIGQAFRTARRGAHDLEVWSTDRQILSLLTGDIRRPDMVRGSTWSMSIRGSVAAPVHPIDVTGELPLVGEEEIFPVDPQRRKRKFVLIGVAVTVVLGAATGLSLRLTSGSPTTGLVVTTEVAKVTTGTIKETVATSGTLEPATQASLNFDVSGTVTAVNVKAGQEVTVGEVLATVGTAALQADVDSAQAQLESAQARLSSDESSSAATTQIDSDEASVTSAESSLTSAKTSLADGSLTSTISGTVAAVSLTIGEQVTGSGGGSSTSGSSVLASSSASNAVSTSSSSSTTSQISVVGTDSYIVNTTVDDTEIGQITDGDQATITPTGATTVSYGTVASIGLIATESSGVATFPVVVDVTGDPSELYAGSTASVSIVVKQLNNVVEVPTAAISYSTGGQATVTQVKGGKRISTAVSLGQAESGETQITSGLVPGDRLVERVVKFTGGTGAARTGGLGGLGGTSGGLGGTGSFPTGVPGGSGLTPPSGGGG
jgi:macrolide-specific efflux system membrane fusion protein